MEEEEKYYYFRDLESNLVDGRIYHAAGIVDKVYNTKENANGNKDLSVMYFGPFDCTLMSTWRTYSEVELFEVDEGEWNYLKLQYDKIR